MSKPATLLRAAALALLAMAVTAQPTAQPQNKVEASPPAEEAVFSEAVAKQVLGNLHAGLEGHNPRRLLSAFDADKMDGYMVFQDRIQALFERFEAFRVHLRIAQTTTEGARGVALVDIQMEQVPRGGAAPPLRKGVQMRFVLERGRQGWKIVDFRPRDFFSS